MSRRRALTVTVVVVLAIVADFVLVRAMAHGHVAHALLGAGNGLHSVGPALLALALVLVRLIAIVLGPGALLAASASLVAHAVIGPKGSGDAGVLSSKHNGESPKSGSDRNILRIGGSGDQGSAA